MTLLELLLSLALTGVVMVIISMAIHLHLFTLDTRRADVEQALLARSVLRHMAADIRNAVWYEKLDMTSLANMATTGTGSAQSGNATDSQQQSQSQSEQQSQSQNGQQSQSQSQQQSQSQSQQQSQSQSQQAGSTELDLTTEPSENTTDIANTVTPTSVPGLYGNQYELRIDCSRLPRVDEYSGTVDPATGAAASIPSDVKNIAYFLRTEESATGGMLTQGSGGTTGLVRRVLDRAVASWSAQGGTLDASEHPGDVLAKEVTYLAFRYSDGSAWYTEWDSEQMGGLPVAIEISIGVDPLAAQNPQDMTVATANQITSAEMSQSLYRLVVHLPVAQPLMTEDTLGITGDSTGSTSGAADASGGVTGTTPGGTP
jgi:hypothetical protein